MQNSKIHSDWERDPQGGWKRKDLVHELRAETESNKVYSQLVQANLDRLRSQVSNSELLVQSYELALRRFPELQSVTIVPKADKTPGAFARHHYHSKNFTGGPELYMDLAIDSEKRLYAGLQARASSLKIISEKLNIPADQLTPKLAQAFVLLHELGHALDYIHSVRNAAEGKQRDKQRWQEMQRLPIRNASPSRLLDPSVQAQLLQDYPDLFDGLSRRYGTPIKSMQDVLALQEAHYRNLPSEVLADEFAVAILTGGSFDLFNANVELTPSSHE